MWLEGLFDLISQIFLEYRPANIYVNENGASYSDAPGADGWVDDERRIEYLRIHIAATSQALHRGVLVNAYFVRSLLDVFE